MAHDKYMWAEGEFDEWIKKEKERVRKELGLKLSTPGATKLIRTKILIPNHISLVDLFPTKPIKIKKKRKNE